MASSVVNEVWLALPQGALSARLGLPSLMQGGNL